MIFPVTFVFHEPSTNGGDQGPPAVYFLNIHGGPSVVENYNFIKSSMSSNMNPLRSSQRNELPYSYLKNNQEHTV